jgi:hypothetical protein
VVATGVEVLSTLRNKVKQMRIHLYFIGFEKIPKWFSVYPSWGLTESFGGTGTRKVNSNCPGRTDSHLTHIGQATGGNGWTYAFALCGSYFIHRTIRNIWGKFATRCMCFSSFGNAFSGGISEEKHHTRMLVKWPVNVKRVK